MTPKNAERIKELQKHLTDTYMGASTHHEYQLVYQFVKGMKEADANALEWVKEQMGILEKKLSYDFADCWVALKKILEAKDVSKEESDYIKECEEGKI